MIEEEENGEQNIDIDEFLKNALDKLSKNDDKSKDVIIQILNNYFLTINNNKEQCDNFFIKVNSIIFLNNSNNQSPKDIFDNKNFNIHGFKLYPIIYSFNPKLTVNYVDYFLSSLMQSTTEKNKSNFSFLSSIFADIIDLYYNNNDMEIHKLLDNEQKQKLYQKFFDFINNNIKTNKRIEQSLGFLLLNELIEKCPLVKEHKHLALLFKEISRYLDDRWFKCKLDLLNCIISLIFKVGEQFKPYANVCLFRILDNLTDSDWMKRKLAINIVYTLVFYCKKEMMAVKKNIIEFLNILKEDEVAEVREICIQTLKFIEKSDNKGKDSYNYMNKNNISDNRHNNLNNSEKNNKKNKTNFNINKIFDKNKYNKNINSYFDNGLYLYNLIREQSTPKNYNNNINYSLQNIKNNNFRKGSTSIGTLENYSNNTYKYKDYFINLNSANNINKTKAKININNLRNINNIKCKYNNTEISEEKMSHKLNISLLKNSLYNLNRDQLKVIAKKIMGKDNIKVLEFDLDNLPYDKLLFLEKYVNECVEKNNKNGNNLKNKNNNLNNKQKIKGKENEINNKEIENKKIDEKKEQTKNENNEIKNEIKNGVNKNKENENNNINEKKKINSLSRSDSDSLSSDSSLSD